MKNFAKLSEKAAKIVDAKLTTKRQVPSVNDSLVELMVDEGMKMTRTEMVRNVCIHRAMAIHGEDVLLNMPEKEFNKIIDDMVTTVRNGVDQSVSRAQNNAGFNYKYEGIYKMECQRGVYSVIKLNQEG